MRYRNVSQDSLPVPIVTRKQNAYCVPVTQEPKRKPRPSGDEGAPYTARIMSEVKRLRGPGGLNWSAERLAEEMTAVGIPWTRDVVVNLENGRRKTLAVHEVLALAYVLDIAPAILMSGLDDHAIVPVTPNLTVSAPEARSWIQGLEALPGVDAERFARNLPPGMSGALPVDIDEALATLDRVRDSIEARRPLQEHLRRIREQALGRRGEQPRGSDADGEG